MYIGTGVQTLNRVAGEIEEKVDMMMKVVFEAFVSPEEQELKKFITSKCGPERFADNDKLLRDLIQKREEQRKSGRASSSAVLQHLLQALLIQTSRETV